MKKHVAISAIGKDRPGIVAAITKALFQTGCNLEDSTMTLLGGEFATILIVAVPSGVSLAALKRSFAPAVKELGLTLSFKPLKPGEQLHPSLQGKPYVIAVYGADKPGIVYRISAFLAERGINITDVQTNITGEDAAPVYIMLLEVRLPKGVSVPALKKDLKTLATELKVTATVNAAETPSL